MFRSEESLPISPSVGARIPSQERVERASAIAESTARHVGRNLPLPPDEWVIVGHWIGEVVAAPEGEDEHTGAQYWVERRKIDPTIEAADVIETVSDTLHDAADRTVTVTNLAEMLAASHSLRIGDTVHVFEADREDGAIHYYCVAAPSGMVAFKIASNGTGGGKYQLTLLTGDSTAALTGDLNMPEGMTEDADNSAVGVNMAEDGSTTHILPAGVYGIGVITGYTGAGIPIVMFDLMTNLVIRGTATKTGGAAGSLASASDCAFVYTIAGPAGNTLATGVSPEKARIPSCAYTVPTGAQPARLYQDSSGVWHLLDVLTERPVTAIKTIHVNPVWNTTDNQIDFDKWDVLVLDEKQYTTKTSILFYDCDGARPS